MAEPAEATAEEAGTAPPPGVGFLVDITLQRLTKLAVLVAIIAWALTRAILTEPCCSRFPEPHVMVAAPGISTIGISVFGPKTPSLLPHPPVGPMIRASF